MKLLSSLLRVVAILSVTLSVLSCGKEKKSPITFTVRSNKQVLVPGVPEPTGTEAGMGASTTSLSPKFFRFPFPEINIDKARVLELYEGINLSSNRLSFNIVGINIKIDSDAMRGGKFRCIIAGEELNYLYYLGGAKWNPAAITYDAATDQFKATNYYTSLGYTSCPLKCGGVPAKEGDCSVPVTFDLIIIATLLNDDGAQTDVPYKVTTNATLQHMF